MMKKITLYTLVILILSTGISFGQNAHFVNSGVVEFEKTINMYALFKKEIN